MTGLNVVDGSTPVTILAAESGIQVGHHTEAHWFGLTVNVDTVLGTAVAAVLVLALAFFLRAKVTSTGVPNGVQLFWEAITVQLRNQIQAAIGMKIAPFVLPLAVTLFVFILISNWLLGYPFAVGLTVVLGLSCTRSSNAAAGSEPGRPPALAQARGPRTSGNLCADP